MNPHTHHAPIINLGDYDFGAPIASSSHLPSYEERESDKIVHQLSPSFSATFDCDIPSYNNTCDLESPALLERLADDTYDMHASCMLIDEEDCVSINSGRAEARDFPFPTHAEEPEVYDLDMEYYYDIHDDM